MKTMLLILCVIVVSISAVTLFIITNNVGWYSYTPLGCAIKDTFGYFSKENPFDPTSKEFTGEKYMKLITGCLKQSHPAQFQ